MIPKDYSSWPWSPWGDDNLFPQNVLTDLEKNSIALRALEKRKTVHYGSGILAYRNKGKDNLGAPIREIVTDPDVVEFLRINADNIGGWNNCSGPWSSGLRLHTAVYLNYNNGSLNSRATGGYYWRSTQYISTFGWHLDFISGGSYMSNSNKGVRLSAAMHQRALSSLRMGAS